MTAPLLPTPTVAGSAIVRSFEVRPGVYRVTVEHASTGFLVDELCFLFPDPEQATRAHDMAVALLVDHTPAQLVELLAVFNAPPARTAEGCGPAPTPYPPCEEAA